MAMASSTWRRRTLALSNVSVLLGTGTGSFGGADRLQHGAMRLSVSSAGRFQWRRASTISSVANLNSSTVSVFLGTGTGSFGAATDFGTGDTSILSGGGGFQRRWQARSRRGELCQSTPVDFVEHLPVAPGLACFAPATDFGSGPVLAQWRKEISMATAKQDLARRTLIRRHRFDSAWARAREAFGASQRLWRGC